MASILTPLNLIAKATRAFFRSDLHLRRGRRGLEVVLDDPPPPPAKGKADATAEQEHKALELQRMQASLKRLLDELPDNRKTLRHLAFIEHALGKKGLRALGKVPYDVLRRALEQFEGVVVNWSDEGLAALRSKMAVKLIERESEFYEEKEPVPDTEDSVMETVALAQAVALEGDDAKEAEAALRAAYGAAVLPGLDLTDDADPLEVELDGELDSPSARAISKARRAEALNPDSRVRETQF